MIKRISTVFAVIFSLSVGQAVHAADDVFTVARVAVDASGDSAADARDIALSAGRKEAIEALFKRLTPKSYWASLPRYSNSELIEYVAGIQIGNEKTSSTRYLAEVSYSFKPDRIRQALRGNGIPFSEAQSRSAVVIPVYRSPEGTFLWEMENNPWAMVWSNRRLTHELVPMLAPLGELEDMISLTTEDALNANWEKLDPFAQRYGVGGVIIATATLGEDAGVQTLRVDLTRMNNRGSSGLGVDQSTTSVMIKNTEAIALEQLLNFGLDRGIDRLQTEWKSRTIIQSDAVENTLLASVRFSSHQDWLTIRKRIEALSRVTEMQILSLSMNGAEVLLRHLGGQGQLRMTMAQQDVRLMTTDQMTLIMLQRDLNNSALTEDLFGPSGMGTPGRGAPYDGIEVINTDTIMMEPVGSVEPSMDSDPFASDPFDAEPMDGEIESGEIFVDVPID